MIRCGGLLTQQQSSRQRPRLAVPLCCRLRGSAWFYGTLPDKHEWGGGTALMHAWSFWKIHEVGLCGALEQLLGVSVRALVRLEGGDEAVVLRAETTAGPLVVHVSPPWRTRAELAWVHAVARHAQRSVPQVVAPIAHGGETVFACDGRLVAVFPFVEGELLNRDDPLLRADAARLLAAIHRALLTWRGGTRPASSAGKPAPPPDPPELHDPALDAWWVKARERAFVVSATHGDYYRRNLLCAERRIVGVIDWHDAAVGPLALELAGATFELCRDDHHVLDLDRADAFVMAYRAADGPVPDRELAMLLPLMRVWIRSDVRSSLATDPAIAANGYAARQLRAFRELATCTWRPACVTSHIS